jgi:hypothetical protein
MTLLGFKTILHKKCRTGKNSEGPAENSWVLHLQHVCPAKWKQISKSLIVYGIFDISDIVWCVLIFQTLYGVFRYFRHCMICFDISIIVWCVLIFQTLCGVFWYFWHCMVCLDISDIVWCVLIFQTLHSVFCYFWHCMVCFDISDFV